MDYYISPWNEEHITGLSFIIIFFIMNYSHLFTEQSLLILFSTVFLGFITLFVFLELAVRERTRDLIHFIRIFLNIKAKPTDNENPEAYREICYFMIFGPIAFYKIDYKEIENKLIPGMSDSEKERHKLAYQRLNDINYLFKKSINITLVLVSFSVVSLFLIPVLYPSLIIISILVAIVFLLLCISLFNISQLIKKLFWEYRENYYDKQSSKAT